MAEFGKPRLLIFVVAYKAERFIEKVIHRIPADTLREMCDVEILIIDDASPDQTFERAVEIEEMPFPCTILTNPVNQKYGGNQKLGYHYAIEKGFDYVALLHGDGQYAPEAIPALLEPLLEGRADVVFGSRMMSRFGALKGGMPLYKYVGNKILTFYQNLVLGASLSEFHTGFRIYSTQALQAIPFHLNTDEFHFDTDIIIQLLIAEMKIAEVEIPTYYGDEISHVNGMKYAADVVAATTKARMQSLNIFYERKFDCAPTSSANDYYRAKLDYRSPHSMAVEAIPAGSRVLDLGCGNGHVGAHLMEKGCYVVGVDKFDLSDQVSLDEFFQHDLDAGLPPIDYSSFDYIILLDIIEHLRSPEDLVDQLRQTVPSMTKIIASTGNIAFFIMRLRLLMGAFEYGKSGILDLTHTRLFTFKTFRSLFEQNNYDVLQVAGVPLPFPLIFGLNGFSKLLLAMNSIINAIARGLFSFQIFLVAQPKPTLKELLDNANEESQKRLTRLKQEVS